MKQPRAEARFWSALPAHARWLLVLVLAQTIGGGLTLPFTMIYLNEVRGIDLSTAGLLMTLIGGSALVSAGPVGHWIDRRGAHEVLVVASVVASAGAGLLALAVDPLFAAPAFVCQGFNLGAAIPAKNALITVLTPPRLRRRFFAVHFAALNLSLGFGGVVGGLVLDVQRPSTFVAVFLADAALMLSALLVLVWPLRGTRRIVSPVAADLTKPSYLSILREPVMGRIALFAAVSSLIGYGQLESGIPVFGREVSQVSTQVIGLAFAVNTWLIVFLQLWVLRQAERGRRTTALLVLAGVWACGWIVLGSTALLPPTWAAVGFTTFLVVFAFGEMIQQPLLPILVNDVAPPAHRGRYNAAQSGAFQAGAVAGPLVAGVLIHHGQDVAYIATMVTGCALVAALALSLRRSLPGGVDSADQTAGAVNSAAQSDV